MILMDYINSYRNEPFEWGRRDCYTFVRKWIDLEFPQNRLPEHTYDDLKGAYAWNREKDWFKEIREAFNYKIVDGIEAQDGDILIVKDNFQCAHLVANGMVYSIDLRLGLIGVNLKLLEKSRFVRLLRAY